MALYGSGNEVCRSRLAEVFAFGKRDDDGSHMASNDRNRSRSTPRKYDDCSQLCTGGSLRFAAARAHRRDSSSLGEMSDY